MHDDFNAMMVKLLDKRNYSVPALVTRDEMLLNTAALGEPLSWKVFYHGDLDEVRASSSHIAPTRFASSRHQGTIRSTSLFSSPAVRESKLTRISSLLEIRKKHGMSDALQSSTLTLERCGHEGT